MSGSLVECPYNPEHKMSLESLQKHFSKCKSMQKLKHLFKVCPYNPNHHIPSTDFAGHLRGCKDKVELPQLSDELKVVVDPVADVVLITPPPGFASMVQTQESSSPKEVLTPTLQVQAAWSEVKIKKPKKKGDSEAEVLAQPGLTLAEMQVKQSVEPKRRRQELKKKLKEIEHLVEKQVRGEQLDLQQLEKVKKRKVLEDELNSLS